MKPYLILITLLYTANLLTQQTVYANTNQKNSNERDQVEQNQHVETYQVPRRKITWAKPGVYCQIKLIEPYKMYGSSSYYHSKYRKILKQNARAVTSMSMSKNALQIGETDTVSIQYMILLNGKVQTISTHSNNSNEKIGKSLRRRMQKLSFHRTKKEKDTIYVESEYEFSRWR